jgi:hypothetical protein
MRSYIIEMRLSEEAQVWEHSFSMGSDQMAIDYTKKLVDSTKLIGATFWLHSPELCLASYHIRGVRTETDIETYYAREAVG